CIVDTVDELNPNAANALLKILEEPPQRSLFLLVSHAPSRTLPTILSRCRKLPLRPLAVDDVIRAAAAATEIAADDPALIEAAAGMGKDHPRRARYRILQSGTKTAGFLGILDARGSDAVGAPPDINPGNPVLNT